MSDDRSDQDGDYDLSMKLLDRCARDSGIRSLLLLQKLW